MFFDQKKSYNKNTVAVIVVNYSGLPCDMDEIVKFTNSKKILLIEDSAETLGAKIRNKFTGTFGTGCFSFFPPKNFVIQFVYCFSLYSLVNRAIYDFLMTS